MANSTEIKLIAQAHAQQFNKQQNDYYLQMANNMIAENQQNEKYLQMANDMIANENKVSQPVQTQNVQPVETQPVQQKTVNEVKQIPSIADFGKDQDNKTYIQNVIENNILRQQEVGKPYGPMIEEARAQKQNEPSKEQNIEESLKEIARIKNISVDEARRLYEQGPSEEAITSPGTSVLNYKAADELADNEKIQKYLDVNKRLTDSEKEDARNIAQQVLEKYNYRSGNIPVLNSEEDRKRYADAVNLLNKTSPVANFSQSFLNPYTNLARSVRDSLNVMANQTQEGAAKVTDALGITKNAKEKAVEDIENRQKAIDSVDQSTNTATDNAAVQNPLLSSAGNLLGNMSQYYLSGPLFDALGGAAGLGKAGKFLLNQVGQAGQDVILDVLPEYKKMMEDGQITEEEKLELGNRFGGDVLANLTMASLPALNNASFDYLTQTVGKNADVLKAMDASGALKNIPDVIREVGDATKQIPGIDNVTDIYKGVDNYSVDTAKSVDNAIENVAKKSQMELPKETQEQLLSDFEEYYRALDTMDEAAQKSGNAKVIEKFDNLKKAVFDYEEAVWKSEDPAEINTAKKKADSTRQAFVREMKKIDPNYKGELTGTKLGRAEFRRTSIPASDEALEAITELENLGNDVGKDVVKQTDNIAESVGKSADNFSIESVNGKNGQPVYYIALKNGDMTVPIEPGKTYKSAEEAKNALDLNLQFFADKADDIPESAFKERGLSKHIVGEDTPMKMEDVSDEVVADFKDDPDMYKVLTNAETKAKAERIYRESSNAEAQFRRLLAQKDPAALPLGHQLAKDYSAAGDHEAAAQIYRDMGNELTKAGQFSQAAAINMMKNDPLTALQYAERQIDNLNRQGTKRFGDKWKKFSLTDEEKSLFDNIKPGDEEAIKAAYDQIGTRLGTEYPTTLMDKLLEGRKIAMLFNVRTNVRNVLANVPTLGMRWMADRVEALGQNAAHLINPDVKVTQSLTGSGVQGRKLANEVFESNKVQAMLKGDVGKYEIPELKNSLVQNKTMYKGTYFEKWLDKVTGDGIQKLNIKLFGKQGVQSGLETIRNATYKMLDLGDSPFVKENFVERLGSYINAQGIKNIEDVPDEAIEMAWEEAMKATYKDNSWAVQMLSGIKGGLEKVPGIGRPISQAAIPFLQAPGNIAARMYDYSPFKAAKGIADIKLGAGKNDAKMISKGIEETAKGLTGTGLVLLGMALRKAGILTGTFSEDKDQKAFEKQNGFQEYSLHVGDKYFSYDWAQPFAEPLIVGTLLADAITKSDEYNSELLDYLGVDNPVANKTLGVAKEGLKASVNSWFNASPLQGLQELMSGGYNGTDIAQNLIDTGVGDFVGAFVPASVNAVAKSTDNTQRNTYDPSNKFSTFVNQQIAKIPGLSKTLPAKYDTWGNELKNADTKAMAWASRFVIPGNYSYDKGDKVDNEINRLYEEATDSEGKPLHDARVFPQVAPSSISGNKLNNKEMSAYQKDVGTRSRQLVENFISSDSYNTMDDAEKIETISNLYGVSKAITERDLFGKELANNSSYKGAVEAYDNAGGGEKGIKAVVDYLNAKSASDQAGLSANSNAAKSIQEDVQNGNMDAAQEKIDAAQQLPTLGLDKPGPVYTYYNAQEQIPGLTVEEFATTYKAIDTDKNQGIKQDEVIDYLNKNKITSQSEANEIWSAYGNSEWKNIPSIKDGVWTKKKKK